MQRTTSNADDRTLTSSYGWTESGDTESSSYVTPAVLAILERLKARRILDLGCGNGQLCGALHARGFEVTGVDADESGVSIARNAYPGVRFFRAGVNEDPRQILVAEGLRHFDAVVSTEVVEHLSRRTCCRATHMTLLITGGHLVVSTPYHGYLKNALVSLLGRWDHHHTALWHGGHIKFWSYRTLSQLLESNGFSVTAFQGAGRLPFLWKSMIVTAQRVPCS